ncbi:MAG: L,D-transpeptidase family protein [Deltaproteobacteria bacterium]|nr:L,D-transpeptidase family protein [Deltaproteobacteria bacterium]
MTKMNTPSARLSPSSKGTNQGRTSPRLKILIALLIAILMLTSIAQFIIIIKGYNDRKEMLALLANTSMEMDKIATVISSGKGGANEALLKMKAELDSYIAVNRQGEGKTSAVALLPREVNVRKSVAPIVWGNKGEHVLLVEKEKSELHLFRFEESGTTLLKTYPCVVGENKQDKQREGDMATPVGVYFLDSHIPDKDLAELYGAGAYVMNYPSLLDHKKGKQGSGIWLHGHPRDQKLGEDKTSTRGCVVVRNEDLLDLKDKIRLAHTPIVITEKMQTVGTQQNEQNRDAVLAFLQEWRLAWESKDVSKFVSLYSPAFINNQGMDLKAFKAQKEQVAKGKKYIKVMASDVFILTTGLGEGVFVVKFLQDYRSDNYASKSNKLLYIKKTESGFVVVGESSY